MRIPISSLDDVDDILESIEKEGNDRFDKGVTGTGIFPYWFIALDPIDQFEMFCTKRATEKYKKSALELQWLLREEVAIQVSRNSLMVLAILTSGTR